MTGVSVFSPVSIHSSLSQLIISEEPEEATSPDVNTMVVSVPVPEGSTTRQTLENIPETSNPTINFYNPLSLADANFWGQGNEATIGLLYHAEIKDSHIAISTFFGYCVQSN